MLYLTVLVMIIMMSMAVRADSKIGAPFFMVVASLLGIYSYATTGVIIYWIVKFIYAKSNLVVNGAESDQ